MATNNAINTPLITLGGAFTMSGGAYTFTGTLSGNTSVTFPTSGTLLSTSSPSAAAVGTILRSNGSAWVASTLTIPDTFAINTLIYASAANVLSAVPSVADAILITDGSGVPSLSATVPAIVGEPFYDGCVLETASTTVASDGATITLSYEQDGGGDLTLFYSTGLYTLDTTPAATIALTAGTDAVPVLNYVYIPISTKVLTLSTVGWPSEEYVPVATVLCQTAASLQTQGAYSLQAWTDHVYDSNDNGHLSHLNYWIRQQYATWVSGVALTPTAGAGQLDVATASGVVLQLHQQTYPAFDTGAASFVLVPNSSVAAYTSVSDLSTILLDAAGGSLTNKYYSLVFWGVVSDDSGDCQLMCNLPLGSYGNSAAAIADANKYDVFTIPVAFRGTGFLIARVTVRNQTDSTWTVDNNEDLRGLFPSTSTGTGTSGFVISVTGTANEIDVDNTDPQNPVLSLSATINAPGTLNIQTSTAVNAILDEDTMVSDSPTALATQQSIKTYVDTQVGTVDPLTTKGDLFTYSTANDRLPVGATDGQILQVSSGAATGLAWSTPTYPSASGSAGLILRSDGTNNVYSQATYPDLVAINSILFGTAANTVGPITPAVSSVLISNATSTGVPSWSGALANGELIIGSTGAAPVVASITAGTGISITPGAGSITIDSTGGGFTVATIAGTTQSAAVGTMYIALNAGQTTVTLPAVCAVGDMIRLVGSAANTGGWILDAPVGDTIMYLGTATSSGGTITSTAAAGEAIEVVCDVADTSWVVVNTASITLTTA